MSRWRAAFDERFPDNIPHANSAISANSPPNGPNGPIGAIGRQQTNAKELPHNGPADEGWDAETANFIQWLKTTPPPMEPFQLYSGVWIANPTRYWASLRGDIASGPGAGRAYYGAFQGDLRRLAELFGGPM